MLPKEFPHFNTVQRYFYGDEGRWNIINRALLMSLREAAGREASPSVGITDSQSAKTTVSGGPRGYAAEKMINPNFPLLNSAKPLTNNDKPLVPTLVYWLQCDLQQVECPALNRRGPGQHAQRQARRDRHGDGIARQRGQIGEQCPEAVHRQPSGVRSVVCLRIAPFERCALATTLLRAASAAALSVSSNSSGASAWRICHSR